MKISKLFHWLYGAVMLLPLLSIGTTCLVSTFNENSKIIDTKEEYLQSNRFDVDTIYYVNMFDLYNETISGGNIYVHDFSILNAKNLSNANYQLIKNKENQVSRIYVQMSNNAVYFGIYYYDDIQQDNVWLTGLSTHNNNTLCEFSFFVNSLDGDAYKVIYNEEKIDIKNVFYYSVDKVTQSDLFSWAYDSFLVAPFSYIVGLFSMPTNSPVVMLMSYWLAVSIIWLVFDLVMYVPLLVHRWLDKGAIQ